MIQISLNNKRARRPILNCPHTERKHYAKNMCQNCYHRRGKTKMAYACGHPNKSHYSSGMCQNCYLAKYYLKRKEKKTQKNIEAKSKIGKANKVTETTVSKTFETKSHEDFPAPKRQKTI